ncbi:MarR family transcriptional regulator [Nocardia nova]|uniref:MarR family transcriptional regulator n=1 Tax=Nocardia nova TaxID=37330 RepID=A0A2S6A213_9NOCA|nr:MarR family transcriptional regulator [Nocardia nova]PPJ25608.1 MarR family transcriptional regulator [Nocardia nova]
MSTRKKNTTKRAAKNAAETTPAPAAEPAAADAPVLRTDSEKALWTALGNFPGFTAAELAGAAGIAGSTARRILSGWAAAGAARRYRDPDNPRAAEHWSPTAPAEPDTPADTTSEPDTAQPDAATEQGSDTAPTAPESADHTPNAADPATGTQAPPEPAAAAHTGTEAAAATPDAQPDVAAAQEESPQRLAPGALRGEVEDHLRDSPDTEFTPHEIGKVLGRSSGAVHNALVKLTTLGTARQTCTRPKKFALAPGQ